MIFLRIESKIPIKNVLKNTIHEAINYLHLCDLWSFVPIMVVPLLQNHTVTEKPKCGDIKANS